MIARGVDRTGLWLRLCASVEVHSTEPPGPGRHRGATTLAIRMGIDRLPRRFFSRFARYSRKWVGRYRHKTQAKPNGIECAE
jgi:hypothetical protein